LKKKICIVGTGGCGREALCCIIDAYGWQDCERLHEEVVFMVSDSYFSESEVMGVPVIKRSEFEASLYNVVVAIGDPALRKNYIEKMPAETTFQTVIHPSAVLSKWIEIEEGAIIMAGCVLTCNIRIGKHVHLNRHTTIGHDCVLSDYFTTAPAAVVSGNCHFGEGVYLGTNACVKQGITIADNVIIGMGAVVTKPVEQAGTYVGNPLRKLEKKTK